MVQYFEAFKDVALSFGCLGLLINCVLICLTCVNPGNLTVKHELLILYRHIISVDILSCALPIAFWIIQPYHLAELGSVTFLLVIAQFFLSSLLTILSLLSASSLFRKINFIVSVCVGIWLLSTLAGAASLLVRHLLKSSVFCEVLRTGYFVLFLFAGAVCSLAGLARVTLLLIWICRLVQLSPSWLHYSRPLLVVLAETLASLLSSLASLACGVHFYLAHTEDLTPSLAVFVLSVCLVSCVNGAVILHQPYYRDRIRRSFGCNSHEPILSSYFIIKSGVGAFDISLDTKFSESLPIVRRFTGIATIARQTRTETMRTVDDL